MRNVRTHDLSDNQVGVTWDPPLDLGWANTVDYYILAWGLAVSLPGTPEMQRKMLIGATQTKQIPGVSY